MALWVYLKDWSLVIAMYFIFTLDHIAVFTAAARLADYLFFIWLTIIRFTQFARNLASVAAYVLSMKLV